MTSCVSRVISTRLQSKSWHGRRQALRQTCPLHGSEKLEVVVKKRTAPIIRRHVGNWIHVSEWCGVNKWTHLNACPDDSSSFRNEVDWSSVFKDVIDWWVQLPCKCCTVPTIPILSSYTVFKDVIDWLVTIMYCLSSSNGWML